jgi:hypothetical protein
MAVEYAEAMREFAEHDDTPCAVLIMHDVIRGVRKA